MAKCSFCGGNIEKGTGKMFVYATGKQEYFCSSKCEKNRLKLKRKPAKLKWARSEKEVNKND
ncbi:50S ribosomal protein L24e [Candidatus Woesearchaeota archaeon]|jgi:large subunit ribosomal protein L24e|nr:50S ribosomal protein L24e [Candidatus Woesearchaeota archaeon]|tara:strand:+ start:9672 stop:9857 length:186 start_codon:yes stop_codon:yes gene_type:complete